MSYLRIIEVIPFTDFLLSSKVLLANFFLLSHYNFAAILEPDPGCILPACRVSYIQYKKQDSATI